MALFCKNDSWTPSFLLALRNKFYESQKLGFWHWGGSPILECALTKYWSIFSARHMGAILYGCFRTVWMIMEDILYRSYNILSMNCITLLSIIASYFRKGNMVTFPNKLAYIQNQSHINKVKKFRQELNHQRKDPEATLLWRKECKAGQLLLFTFSPVDSD